MSERKQHKRPRLEARRAAPRPYSLIMETLSGDLLVQMLMFLTGVDCLHLRHCGNAVAATVRRAVGLLETSDAWIRLQEIGELVVYAVPVFTEVNFNHEKLSPFQEEFDKGLWLRHFPWSLPLRGMYIMDRSTGSYTSLVEFCVSVCRTALAFRDSHDPCTLPTRHTTFCMGCHLLDIAEEVEEWSPDNPQTNSGNPVELDGSCWVASPEAWSLLPIEFKMLLRAHWANPDAGVPSLRSMEAGTTRSLARATTKTLYGIVACPFQRVAKGTV